MMSMQAILAASQSMTRMQTMQSSRTQMQGKANILRAESKQDGGNEKKEVQAGDLEDRSDKLMDDLMNESVNVNETLKPDENVKTETVVKEEAGEAEKQPKTDTLEISDSAANHIDGASHMKAVVGEAVTYHADGSTVPSAAAQSAPVFQAIA